MAEHERFGRVLTGTGSCRMRVPVPLALGERPTR